MKKIILSLILTLVFMNPANAKENYDDIDWINFDWSAVVLDQYIIDHANMYAKIWGHMESNAGTATVKEFVAPGFDTQVSSMMTSEYQKALDFFGVKTSSVIYFSEDSQSWFPQKMIELDGWHDSVWLQRHCNVEKNSICGMATGENHYYHMVGSQYRFDKWLKYVAHHESAHGYQNSAGLSRQDRNNRHPNCWIREGQAEALAMASYARDYQVDFHRDNLVKNAKNILGEISYLNKNNMINSFKSIQSNSGLCFQKGVGYSVGFLLTEYMYIHYSVNQVHNLIKDLIANYSFDQSLQRNMRINEDQFYNLSFDYIIDSYQRSID